MKLILFFGLSLLFVIAGCTQTDDAVVNATNQSCGDGICFQNESSYCCQDCGCEANFVCNNHLMECEVIPSYALSKTLDLLSSANSTSSISNGLIITSYDDGTSKSILETHFYMESEQNLDQRMLHMYAKTGNTISEYYIVQDLQYLYLSGGNWVKSKSDTDKWTILESMQNDLTSIMLDMKSTINGTANVNGAECWIISLSPVSTIQNLKIKTLLLNSMVESEDIEGINDFKLISWELYIDKESYAILMENVSVSYYNGDIKVNMNLNTEYDYDNVTITLPPSVRNAIDKEDFYSSILCSGFDSTNNIIRWKTLEVVSNNPGQYSMNQLCDLYDFVNNNITYVPNSGDFYPQSVEQTLSAESGNCVDQSLLLASMIESLGGWTRLVVNDACDHAYVEVYIANNDEDVNTTTDFILDRYSDKDQIVRWHNDDDGTKWLILDPAGGKYPGDLYPDCYSEIDEDSWEDIGGTENLEFIYSCVD